MAEATENPTGIIPVQCRLSETSFLGTSLQALPPLVMMTDRERNGELENAVRAKRVPTELGSENIS